MVHQETQGLLRLARYRFHMLATGPIRMPAFPGSAWRGLFGHALRNAVCVTGKPHCEGCMLRQSCVYSLLFETPVPNDAQKLRLYPSAPHPFVFQVSIEQPRMVEENSLVQLEMTLFGKANDYLPYVAHAMNAGGKHGLGHHSGTYQLVAIEQESAPANGQWQTIYQHDGDLTPLPAVLPQLPEAPQSAQVELLSPLRIKRDGSIVGPQNFAFHDLYRNLLRRLSLLAYFHGESPLELDFPAWTQAARQVSFTEAELRWYDWTRFSSRQNSAMAMGGLMGRFTLQGDALQRFWPHLWLGQWTHAGKATSMGLGCYRIHTASLPAAQAVAD